MRFPPLLLLTAAGAAMLVAAGCQRVTSTAGPTPAGERSIDDIIKDLRSDSGDTVEQAAQAVMTGNRPAAELQRAIPYLEAAARKSWGLDRIKFSINQALRAAKRAKPAAR